MGESRVFDWVCDAVERRTTLNRLQARGTVRLTLKHAGLEATSVTAKQMSIVVSRLMPTALMRVHVQDAATVCGEIAAALAVAQELHALPPRETAYEVFRRFGRDPSEDEA